MSQKEHDELTKVGQQMVAGEDERLKAAVRASESQVLNLVSAFQHPPGAFVESNTNVIISAERVAHAPGIKSGADYLTK